MSGLALLAASGKEGHEFAFQAAVVKAALFVGTPAEAAFKAGVRRNCRK